MSFRSEPTSATLNDLERHYDPSDLHRAYKEIRSVAPSGECGDNVAHRLKKLLRRIR